jgi:hypothetical protein
MLTEKIEARRNINWMGRVVYVEGNRRACRVWLVEPEGKESPGGTRRRWEDNVELNLKEMKCEGVNRTYLT